MFESHTHKYLFKSEQNCLMLAELKDIHQVHDWLMKENNIKELGENNRTKNTFKMFSLKELHYDISTEGATLQWISY